jgi:hypothetical protein
MICHAARHEFVITWMVEIIPPPAPAKVGGKVTIRLVRSCDDGFGDLVKPTSKDLPHDVRAALLAWLTCAPERAS